ncbi:OmpA family protein [Ottowia thiooxydans]|uniref:OmpA family protein n=1 Tax=Ottowia thiooxydans TaxID=219182 RepID=UPI000422E5EB|nr:OmpA family protein [Ottowia thiooxydans]
MNSQDDDNQGLALGVVFSMVLLAVGLTLGVGIYKSSKKSPATSAAIVATPGAGVALGGAAAGATVIAVDAASIVVETGVVKFYFASGKAELAPGAKDALGDIVKGVAAGQIALISGFHDTSGDPALNEELAKQRAIGVRDTLISLGIGEDKLDLRKPEVTLAGGTNAEARRVEVRLQ